MTQLFWLQWFCHTISTHTLTWSVTCWQGEDNPCTVHFNSHAHVERDAKVEKEREWNSRFQLTRSRGAWQCLVELSIVVKKFQLTRSRGAWHSFFGFNDFVTLFQLTRSRGAWLADRGKITPAQYISTHTLTWSVTRKLKKKENGIADFNSHAHVERDSV